MLANFLIGLREGLEAGLIVGILIAYLRKIGRTDVLPRLWVGIGAAIVVFLATGAILTWGPYALSEQAEKIVAASLSILAVGLVTWMVLWMARNARDLRGDLQGKLDAAVTGAGLGIAVLGFVTVGREGVETALFVWASVLASGTALLSSIGAFLGIFTAIAISYLIFRGFVRINLSTFFMWTGLFLVLVAAGVLASATGNFQAVGLLPGGGQQAFSLVAIVPPGSWYGTLLAGIFGFTANPTWLQVAAWLAYLVIVTAAFLRQSISTASPATDAAGSNDAAEAIDSDATPAPAKAASARG